MILDALQEIVFVGSVVVVLPYVVCGLCVLVGLRIQVYAEFDGM